MTTQTANTPPPTALVFGASGVTGHGIIKSLLAYPTPTTFSRVIGLTQRPLSHAIARLPEDDRLELYSEINLLDREKSLLQLQHVPNIQQVTHVYYAAYAGHGSSFEELKRVNCELLTNAIGGIEICCPALQFVTLNTGGKAYGIEFASHVPFTPPLHESLPRIPEPYASNIFYYEQADILSRASTSKPWSYCEIRPDVIVGFVPQNNAMNMAQGLGLFFSLYREYEGEGAEVAFPYGQEAWEALHTDSSADVLGRFHVFASLAGEAVAGRAFNVVDTAEGFAWRDLWPKLAGYFGLVGTGPVDGKGEEKGAVKKYVHDRRGEWEGFVARRGLKDGALEGTGFEFVDDVMGIPIRRDYDSSSRREVGFVEERDPFEGYRIAFDEMRAATIIP